MFNLDSPLIPLHLARHDNYFILLRVHNLFNTLSYAFRIRAWRQDGDHWILGCSLVSWQRTKINPSHLFFRSHVSCSRVHQQRMYNYEWDCIVMVVCMLAINLSIRYWHFEWTTRWTRMSLRTAPFRNGGIRFAVLQSPEESNMNSKGWEREICSRLS